MVLVTALGLPELKPTSLDTTLNEVKPTVKEEQCECGDNRSPESKISAFEAEQYIEFENELHNIIYIK